MERRRERVSRGLLLLTLLLLLLCNLLSTFPHLTPAAGREKKLLNENGGYFTTGDSLNSQKRHSGAENKVEDAQNRDSEAENNAESDELESARQTNKLRLQHLKRACEEVGNASLMENSREMYKILFSIASSSALNAKYQILSHCFWTSVASRLASLFQILGLLSWSIQLEGLVTFGPFLPRPKLFYSFCIAFLASFPRPQVNNFVQVESLISLPRSLASLQVSQNSN